MVVRNRFEAGGPVCAAQGHISVTRNCMYNPVPLMLGVAETYLDDLIMCKLIGSIGDLILLCHVTQVPSSSC